MPTNDLAALSAAATKALERAMVLADADCEPETMRQARLENTAAHDRLAYALVNEYRAGRLVQIDEGMRDAVHELLYAAYHEGATNVHDAWVAGLGQHESDFGEAASDYAGDTTDAAIAAILGGAK